MVTNAQRVEVEVGADGSVSAPPTGATAVRRRRAPIAQEYDHYKAMRGYVCHHVAGKLWLAAPKRKPTKEVPIRCRRYDIEVDVVKCDASLRRPSAEKQYVHVYSHRVRCRCRTIAE
jgi:hypothetical protein